MTSFAKSPRLMLSLLLMLITPSAFAKSVAVFPATGDAPTELLSKLTGLSNAIALKRYPGEVIETTVIEKIWDGQSSAGSVAGSLGVEAWIRTDVESVDGGYRIALRYLEDKGKVESRHSKVLNSIDLAEQVLNELFDAMDADRHSKREIPAEKRVEAKEVESQTPETQNVGNTTASETASDKSEPEFRKRPTNQRRDTLAGIKLGVQGSLLSGFTVRPLLSLAFDLRFEFPRYFVEFETGGSAPTPYLPTSEVYGGIFVGAGAYGYLVDTEIAPYLGGGTRVRLLFGSFDEGIALNIAPHVSFGAMFFRNSTTRFYMEVVARQNVLPIIIRAVPYYPTEVGGAIGVGW